MFSTLLLGACDQREPGVFAPVEGFAGVVTGDEPRAVLIGREVLGNGGTAVDAAVAMYFAMAVTLPSRVGLGGGGVCVLFQGQDRRGHAIEFLPRAAPSGGMVPSGMRAMAALHARYGALRWEQLLAPAESLARFGHAVSRSFERDLVAAVGMIAAAPSSVPKQPQDMSSPRCMAEAMATVKAPSSTRAASAAPCQRIPSTRNPARSENQKRVFWIRACWIDDIRPRPA